MKSKIGKKVREMLRSNTSTTISINGSVVHGCVVGRDLVISDKVVVNGEEVMDLRNVGPVTIVIEGSVELMRVTAGSVTVNGDVGEAQTVSGGITVHGSVHGDCETVSGSIEARTIMGDCETVSGSIRCSK